MSDVPRGPGWWRASDGRWYPPVTPPPPPTPAKRRRPLWPWVLIVGLAVPLGAVMAIAASSAEDEAAGDDAARSACDRFEALTRDAGALTPPELVARVSDVQEAAQYSAVPDLAAAANELQAGAILSDAARVSAATRRVADACGSLAN